MEMKIYTLDICDNFYYFFWNCNCYVFIVTTCWGLIDISNGNIYFVDFYSSSRYFVIFCQYFGIFPDFRFFGWSMMIELQKFPKTLLGLECFTSRLTKTTYINWASFSFGNILANILYILKLYSLIKKIL